MQELPAKSEGLIARFAELPKMNFFLLLSRNSIHGSTGFRQTTA